MQRSKNHSHRRAAPPDVLRRSAIACDRCRRRKQKCLGRPPLSCATCNSIGEECVYSESEKRVSVPESYLLRLQSQARSSSDALPSPAGTASSAVQWTFAGSDNWILCQPGQYHYIGNSSSTYIANQLNPTTENLAWHLYPHYEDTSWLRRDVLPEMPQLPPFDFAKRLYSVHHAYIGTIFSFIVDREFYERLKRVYSSPPNLHDRDDCLIFCQILLVFAFGQMYSVNQWTGNNGPPGFQYFKHALQFLPQAVEDGSILFVEVLSYVAYYLQTINRRDSAYLYIGLALRMAISLGLHQETLDTDINGYERERRRRVWWSTYSLERLLCVTSGHPISVDDDDIDLLEPSPLDGEEPRRSSVLLYYTRLSRILGRIGRDVYRKKRQSGTTLLAVAQNILKSLSEWFRQLPDEVRIKPDDLEKCISRELVSTYLHYYHCINMTARPLLLYAVQRQMASNAASGDGATAARWEDGLSSDVVGIIDAAISAARSSTTILNAAAKFNLVATYGFIDGEQAFSAALLLVMVNIAFPYTEMNASTMDMALLVLQSMAEKGNKYIRACHDLLTKIRSTIKPNTTPAQGEGMDREEVQRQLAWIAIHGASGDQQQYPQQQGDTFPVGNADDRDVWVDVIESIDIDMDRQWIGTTLMRQEGLSEGVFNTTPP
ncbi:fungal-specific transcription factor domain-containing protein [Talaromyces proteolyticus]|uniref:Fungal-specific transcription factor domain-containing protein n=1 Tax=Talaromyces proteolyticus TaxID=1131652 RepID=A0AAD4KDN7_9EURO|nr:fungal-specific transcription factor domain-containing protein [Talaromyces proteolyticus]KAH8689332.1 fungal-specific transcription factor domain-containing protein [Talaromyces proteolyticus]